MIRVSWVEIPVNDLERATAFYKTVFEMEEPQLNSDDERKTAVLINSGDDGSPGLSLNETANFEPSDKGTLAYLHVGKEVEPYLERTESAGGAVVAPKTDMGGGYYYAMIRDTEGNVLALSAH